MNHQNSESAPIARGAYDISQLREHGFDAMVNLLEGNVDAFYAQNDASLEGCVPVSTIDELKKLFTEGVFLERERQRLELEAEEVYAHELEHKREAKNFGVSPVIYFRHQEKGKHIVFVHVSSDQLRAKFSNAHLSLMRFYAKVMRAPSLKGAGNYPLEEKLANTLFAKVRELDTSSYEPLE